MFGYAIGLTEHSKITAVSNSMRKIYETAISQRSIDMYINRARLRNLLLQKLYRPRPGGYRFISPRAMAAFEDLNQTIEKEITPLLSEFF